MLDSENQSRVEGLSSKISRLKGVSCLQYHRRNYSKK